MGVKILNPEELPGGSSNTGVIDINNPEDFPGSTGNDADVNITGSDIVLPVKLKDVANRLSLNTVFGEQIIGIRKPSFAAQFQYPIQTDKIIVVQSNGGTVSQANSLLVAQTGTNAAGEASVTSKSTVRYFPGNEAYCFFTAVYTLGVANSTQRAGLFDDENGFFIGYEGSDFAVGRKRATVEFVTIQDDFNFDKLDGTGESGFTIDTTKMNVFCITYGYLGAAPIVFTVLKEDGTWIPFHIIEYPNSAVETHIANAYLPIRGEVKNIGNTSNITLKSGSIAAGIVDGGNSTATSRYFTYNRGDLAITAGTTVLFVLRSKLLVGTTSNKIATLLKLVSGAVELNKISSFAVVKNPTFSNTPTWTSIDIASSIEVSTDATITGGTGTERLTINLSKIENIFIPLGESFNIKIFPTDYWAFTITTTGAGDTNFSARWEELF